VARRDDVYEIIVVRHGTRESSRSHLYLNYADYAQADAPMRIDYYFWVVRNPTRTILIDLGYSERAARQRGREVLCRPMTVWRELGIDPASFSGDVVVTHAHWDHTGHISEFPRARFVMSRREHEFWAGEASAPHLFRHLADESDLEALATVHAQGRLSLVSADVAVAPGVRLVHGAGHTPGLLMVEVDTAEGVVLLASDAAHFDEEVARDMPFRHMTNLEASYATFASIRAGRHAAVLAGHEPGILERFTPLAGPLSAHASVVGKLSDTDTREGHTRRVP
jgi:glyoxylase-like metal-dependent hydrolase (beta-lactamase superfamily II)